MVLPTIAAWLGAITLASTARAQAPPQAEQQSRDTTPVHRLVLDATRIQPAQFTYRLTLTRDTVTSPMGDQSVAISTLEYHRIE